MDADTEKTLQKYIFRIFTARAALKQVWEKYGETNDEVLAAAVDFDQILNEYGRFVRKIDARATDTNR